jgi:hypothetical protein
MIAIAHRTADLSIIDPQHGTSGLIVANRALIGARIVVPLLDHGTIRVLSRQHLRVVFLEQ